MRSVFNHTLFFIFKRPPFNFVLLNTLFFLTSLQVAYLSQDYANILPRIKEIFKEKEQSLSINLAPKNFKATTFSQLGQITAKSASSKSSWVSLTRLKMPELKAINISSFKGLNFTQSHFFDAPNNPKDLLGGIHFNHLIIKDNMSSQSIISPENPFILERSNFFQRLKMINLKEALSEESPVSLMASWLEKVQDYDHKAQKDVLFSKAFESTLKDLKFLKLLSSDYDPATKDQVLRDLSAEFFWTLEGYVGLENERKSAFNVGNGKFNQDSNYELYMPVADFFKTHKVLSCSCDDICDFIGKHS
ncbi:MAG: hypothetical protein J0H12_01330 [Candidatus Paracaedimonas acanthamoebae]|mgnify:CR=1 FL=1|uniref:Uncharacterized protein n=1 Tax=Candidatus Paracaedimonas acanthamoebae TaxID=244581 RepID=A0A8J7PS24_9PROT|nr:hypothetical protein [Candidatus Paracaedimonas acanthamoebae]